MATGKSEIQPITEANLDQAVERLSELKGRIDGARRAVQTAFCVGALLYLFLIADFLLVGNQILDAIPELAAVPFLGPVFACTADFLGVLPEAWYLQLFACAAVAFLLPSVVCLLLRAVLLTVFKRGRSRLTLPKDPIEKAKKLHQTAGKLVGYQGASLIPASVLGGLFLVALGIAVSLADPRPSAAHVELIWDSPVVTAVVLCIACVLLVALMVGIAFLLTGIFFLVNQKWSRFPANRENTEQARVLQKEFHKYWMSIDPEEKARVEEEERRRWRGSGSINWGAGTALYEQYKSDAARSMGYSSGSSAPPSSGLTDKDHDDLDAVQRAIDRHDHDGV